MPDIIGDALRTIWKQRGRKFVHLVVIKDCDTFTLKAERVERLLKNLRGIRGGFANFHSTTTKIANPSVPNVMKRMTKIELHGAEVPLNWRPVRSMRVAVTIVTIPIQPIFFSPCRSSILGGSSLNSTKVELVIIVYFTQFKVTKDPKTPSPTRFYRQVHPL